MLYDQAMPKFLWVEACNTTVYVQNRVPHKALGKVTPKSVFTGSKPEVSHFRIFGSIAYCHVPDEKRKKSDQTAKRGTLWDIVRIRKLIASIFPRVGRS